MPVPPTVKRVGSTGLAVAGLAMVAGAFLLTVLGFAPTGFRSDGLLVTLALLGLGSLLTVKRPANPVGWLLAAAGCGAALLYLSNHVPATTTPGAVLALLGLGGLFAAVGLPTSTTLLLFPTGRLLSPRWKPVLWAGLLSLAVMAATQVLMPLEPTGVDASAENPFAVPALTRVLETAFKVSALVFAASVVLAVVSLLVRYRRAGVEERLQVKWVAVGSLVAVALVATQPLLTRLPLVNPALVTETALLLVPGSIVVAILRYRLYEIDRLISRTVSYAVITGVLVVVYAGGVVALGRLLAPLTRESEVAVAASTLLVAALFAPVRRRVQTAVDRRFNRARYHAQKVVERFAGQLREKVDLDDLQAQLCGVVAETVQPASVSVWLQRRTS